MAILQWMGKFSIWRIKRSGVDIRAKNNRYGVYFLIETKGEGSDKSKSLRSQQETHFIYGLGQLITRMNVSRGQYQYGLGFPESIAKIAIRRIPYQIATKLRLNIFSVNSDGIVARYQAGDLRKHQTKKDE